MEEKTVVSFNKATNKATQTLFRTLSKNNYVLEEMIDRKAHIMITTNAIVISIILGSTLCQPVLNTINSQLILVLLGVWGTAQAQSSQFSYRARNGY